ncbi:MAG: hypothetical protein COY40_02410 [Alphaproteobacteria bacterium CG_4_10_14_0_8_um_filter_53_9]|nr:MAG: hypothetical protein COY40_02410 [Alphaproteobacteria bacterium CG_4_10_14_0_8_um_filter_53_9]
MSFNDDDDRMEKLAKWRIFFVLLLIVALALGIWAVYYYGIAPSLSAEAPVVKGGRVTVVASAIPATAPVINADRSSFMPRLSMEWLEVHPAYRIPLSVQWALVNKCPYAASRQDKHGKTLCAM